MANCDDLNELHISHVDDISAHDLLCDQISTVGADEHQIFEASITERRCDGDSDQSFSNATRTDANEIENGPETSADIETHNAPPPTEGLASLVESPTSPEPIPHSPPFIDVDLECERLEDHSSADVAPNVQIMGGNPSTHCSDAPVKSSRDPVRKQGVQPLRRIDCRVIFSSKDNNSCCSIESSSCGPPAAADVASKSHPPTNNNVAQSVNKENEFIVESAGGDPVSPVDTVLPLAKTTHAIVSAKKRRSTVSPEQRGRRVSFPEDTSIITSYLEPVNPWLEMADVNHDDIIRAYRASCDRHATCPVPAVLQQISALPLVFGGRVQCLNLRNHKLDNNQCESLEEVFRRVQFKMLNLESCDLDDDSVIPLFDMIEFYDSCTQLNISRNITIGSRGWQMCAKMLKKSQSIELLDAHSTNLCEQTVPILARVLRLDTKLRTLHLENCNLTERPLAALAGALRVNDTLQELYLADNRIGPKDCIHLENLVALNTVLRTLDLRNNNIQDEGCKNLCQGIRAQQRMILPCDGATSDSGKEALRSCQPSSGLRNLVLWNNHLTFASVSSIALLMSSSNSLQTLNLGKNSVTSEGMIALQCSLLQNTSITNLGLQATRIEDEGVIALAECLAGNAALQRIDLRENNVKVAGLSALASVLANVNRTIVTVDLDATNRFLGGSEEERLYSAMRTAIAESCRRNHVNSHFTVEAASHCDDGLWMRKASLTCETIAPLQGDPAAPPPAVESKRYFSPEPSPCASPSASPVPSPVNSRFRVCKATDNFPAAPKTSLLLSTSAPAVLTMPPEVSCDAGVAVAATGPVANRFSRYRFTVTRVTDTPKLLGCSLAKTMSAPSLIIPDNYYGTEGAVVVPSIKVKTVEPFLPQNDSSPSDDVFLDAECNLQGSANNQDRCNLMKAPLAAMEGESFDTDSEESEAKSDFKKDSKNITASVST